MTDTPDENQGGQGVGDESYTLTDLKLNEKALKERWPMSREVRVAILKRMAGLIDLEAVDHNGKRISNRVAISACKVIEAADRLNLAQAHLDLLKHEPEIPSCRDALEEAESRAAQHRPAVRAALAEPSEPVQTHA